MRSTALAAIGLIASGACAAPRRAPTLASLTPYPSASSPADPLSPEDAPAPALADGRAIRVVSAASIRAVSAADPPCGADPMTLRAPHRGAPPPPPPLRQPASLREHVGRRDRRDPLAALAAWSTELGNAALPDAGPGGTPSGAALISWAAETGRLRPATDTPLPGDLLVFDRAASDEPADLVGLVIERDARGVTELVYLAAGVIRRGLVDASRPTLHRDASGATVNTYLRHGRRWPTPGTHYLAGELLGGVIRMR